MYFRNVLNFEPTIYRHAPIDHDDFIDVFFSVEDPTTYEHEDLFYRLGVRKLLTIYICLFVLGVDPEAHDR